QEVARKTGKSIKDTTSFVNAILETIRETLESGDSVRLPGFGVFRVRDTPTTVRVNPQTRQRFNAPPSRRVKFAPSTGLRVSVSRTAPKDSGSLPGEQVVLPISTKGRKTTKNKTNRNR